MVKIISQRLRIIHFCNLDRQTSNIMLPEGEKFAVCPQERRGEGEEHRIRRRVTPTLSPANPLNSAQWPRMAMVGATHLPPIDVLSGNLPAPNGSWFAHLAIPCGTFPGGRSHAEHGNERRGAAV
jgi:hypothetical protein